MHKFVCLLKRYMFNNYIYPIKKKKPSWSTKEALDVAFSGSMSQVKWHKKCCEKIFNWIQFPQVQENEQGKSSISIISAIAAKYLASKV